MRDHHPRELNECSFKGEHFFAYLGLERSAVICQIDTSRLNQVCHPSVSSSQIHRAVAFIMSPTSVGFRVKPGMR